MDESFYTLAIYAVPASKFFLFVMLPTVLPVTLFLYMILWKVDVGKCMVMEKFGNYTRVVGSGVHLCLFERPKRVSWHHTAERQSGNGGTSTYINSVSFTEIPLNNCQMDCVPFLGVTSDGVHVSVNGTLHYKITNPKSAVYETDNLLSFLEDCVAQSVRVTCKAKTFDALLGGDYTIAVDLMEKVNEQSKCYGVECSKFMIQEIMSSKDIKQAREESVAATKRAETEMIKLKREHEIQMTELELCAEREEAGASLRLKKAKANREIEQINAQSQKEHLQTLAEGKVFYYQSLMDIGIPSDKIQDVLLAEQAKEINKLILFSGVTGCRPGVGSPLDNVAPPIPRARNPFDNVASPLVSEHSFECSFEEE
jgi:regulator of protease activity HflC (stomatin/prohibitin superfamily)